VASVLVIVVDVLSGAVAGTAVTDASGRWTVCCLMEGNYSVHWTLAQPPSSTAGGDSTALVFGGPYGGEGDNSAHDSAVASFGDGGSALHGVSARVELLHAVAVTALDAAVCRASSASVEVALNACSNSSNLTASRVALGDSVTATVGIHFVPLQAAFALTVQLQFTHSGSNTSAAVTLLGALAASARDDDDNAVVLLNSISPLLLPTSTPGVYEVHRNGTVGGGSGGGAVHVVLVQRFVLAGSEGANSDGAVLVVGASVMASSNDSVVGGGAAQAPATVLQVREAALEVSKVVNASEVAPGSVYAFEVRLRHRVGSVAAPAALVELIDTQDTAVWSILPATVTVALAGTPLQSPSPPPPPSQPTLTAVDATHVRVLLAELTPGAWSWCCATWHVSRRVSPRRRVSD
jgi:hypothetical protein